MLWLLFQVYSVALPVLDLPVDCLRPEQGAISRVAAADIYDACIVLETRLLALDFSLP